ncbi:BatD family protein [Bdellovibrio sp. HCB2-146]|uniref:BatD family protein n=1 Tax=Bdellovibrio sp. HCB2-146 TaxID=3394362 RepID=UPI0039BC50C0
MTKIGNFLIGLIFMMSFSSAFAAGTTVQSSVDTNEVGVGEPFPLTISVVTNENVDIQDPRIPELDGFELLGTSQRTAVAQKLVPAAGGMKFETQRRQEYIYTLNPLKQGTLSIASFEVIIGGKVFRSEPVVMKVGSGGHRPQQQQRQQRPGMPQRPPGFDDPFEAMDQAEEEMFNQLLQQRQRFLQQMPRQQQYDDDQRGGGFGFGSAGMENPAFRSLPTNPNEAFFISVEVDKTEVFEGEQVTVNWYIYTRGQMETLDRLKFPSLKGFWKEIIEEVPSIQFSEEVVNGIPWKKALLASHALFPIKAGTAVIDEYKIKSRVRLPTQGYGFFGKAYEYTKSSSRIPIKVKPLPVEGRPSDFTGAVGQFELHAAVDNPNVPVNQPFSLKVRFEGSGNAKLIDLPVLNLPTGFEQYDSKSESKFFKNGRSFKEFEVLIIPRQEGEVQFPALSVSMFDPATQKYYTRSTQPLTIKVTNNPNAPVGSSSRMADDKVKTGKAAPEKVLPQPLMHWEPSVEASVWTHPSIWFAIYGGILALLGVKALRTFGWHQRRQTLQDLVQKRYKKVDQALSAKDHRKVGAEMTNIFYVVLGEVAGRGGASEEIHRLLEQIPPSVRRDHGAEIEKTFEIFQTLSFAPDEMLGSLKDPGTMKANVDKAKKVISSVISAVDEKPTA